MRIVSRMTIIDVQLANIYSYTLHIILYIILCIVFDDTCDGKENSAAVRDLLMVIKVYQQPSGAVGL
jgi:hypothetical protein